MTISPLLAQANQAFADNRPEDGLQQLRAYNRSNTHDAASWHRQAVIEEQIGDNVLAGQAHSKCIEIAPNTSIAYLYGGYWLAQQGLSESAAALFSLASDLDGTALLQWQNPTIDQPTRLRSKTGDSLLRQVLSDQHRSICSKLNNAQRIEKAVWVQTHDHDGEPPKIPTNYSPELFFIPGLSIQPYYSSDQLPWANELSLNCNKIIAELHQAMKEQLTENSLRPYLDGSFSSHAGLAELANSNNWQAIDLYKNGVLNQKVAELFPETLTALDAIPCYGLDDKPYEVFFSFLKPNQTIAPHYGQSNHALTVHLALDIPPNCYLKVGEQSEHWKEGKILAFDDSFLHSAHNDSDLTRVVLIFSVWHPDLTRDERDAVKHSFQCRQQWLLERQTHLKKLMPT